MARSSSEDDAPAVDHDTLIRLANSCDRAAARVETKASQVSDLDEEDFRTIAAILRRLAETEERPSRAQMTPKPQRS